jgi:transcriptional antiterminator RfaH
VRQRGRDSLTSIEGRSLGLVARPRSGDYANRKELLFFLLPALGCSGDIVRTEYRQYLGRPCGWAVVNTQPHKERVALANLERQGYRAYCPLIRRSRSHARRVEQVLRPLFPSYLFARVDTGAQRWRPMLSTLGVRSLVRCGDRLSLIDDSFVQSLKAREEDGVIARPQSPYRLGQQVRVAGGPFDGLVATIIGLHERERLTVLLGLLSRAVKVQIDEQQISPV